MELKYIEFQYHLEKRYNIFLQATRAAVRFERIFELKNRLAARLSLTLARLKKSLVQKGNAKI
ncbi:MAG: hypothetical protein JXI43_13085 [Tissierellales bacterium]|nr:hypothetical protein [Tissierellales bacterium]